MSMRTITSNVNKWANELCRCGHTRIKHEHYVSAIRKACMMGDCKCKNFHKKTAIKQEVDNPKRIQRKRTRGWKMPANTVYVGRPGKWGNPFSKKDPMSLEKYRDIIFLRLHGNEQKYWLSELNKLRGKNLACWCRIDYPCHADILLELINK